jgi:hypothetical protein
MKSLRPASPVMRLQSIDENDHRKCGPSRQGKMQPVEDFLIFDLDLRVGFITDQAFESPIVLEPPLERIDREPLVLQNHLDLLQIIQRDCHGEDYRKFEQAHGNVSINLVIECVSKDIHSINMRCRQVE